MTLNALVLQELETYGLSDQHLQQLLAICKRGTGHLTWHIDQKGLNKVEVTLFATMRDRRSMTTMTKMLEQERG